MKKRKLYFRHKKTKEINRGTEKGDTHSRSAEGFVCACTQRMQSGTIPVQNWGCTGDKMIDRSSNVSNRGRSLGTALILRSPVHLPASNNPQTRIQLLLQQL